MRFLSASGEEWDIQCSVVQHAMKIQDEKRHAELKSLVEAIGNAVGTRVGEQIGRMFR